MDCSLPSSSVHRIFQARILKWVAISFSRGYSWSRDWTWVSCTAGRFFTNWAKGIIFFSLILTNKEKISMKLRNLPKETQLWMMWVSTNFYLFHTAPSVEKTRFLLSGRFQSITFKCDSLYILHIDHIRFCAMYILSKVCGEKWRNGCWFLLKSVWWRY